MEPSDETRRVGPQGTSGNGKGKGDGSSTVRAEPYPAKSGKGDGKGKEIGVSFEELNRVAERSWRQGLEEGYGKGYADGVRKGLGKGKGQDEGARAGQVEDGRQDEGAASDDVPGAMADVAAEHAAVLAVICPLWRGDKWSSALEYHCRESRVPLSWGPAERCTTATGRAYGFYISLYYKLNRVGVVTRAEGVGNTEEEASEDCCKQMVAKRLSADPEAFVFDPRHWVVHPNVVVERVSAALLNFPSPSYAGNILPRGGPRGLLLP